MADFTGGPGLLAFVATFAMVAGAILLFRSLGKHLRKVRTHPPENDAAQSAAAGDADARGRTAPSADGADAEDGRTPQA